jgi:hypothetical protein
MSLRQKLTSQINKSASTRYSWSLRREEKGFFCEQKEAKKLF